MKILYVTTVSDTVNAFLVPHIEMLLEERNVVDVACNTRKPVSSVITDMGCRVYDVDFRRSPFKISNLKAYFQLRRIIKQGGYDIVHCHTPVASFLTRIACGRMRKKGLKVIYTAHGFHFYKGATITNWLFYYPAEYLCSYITDTIITINNSDFELAKKRFKAKGVRYIPGIGVDTTAFQNAESSRVKKRGELSIPLDAFVILSVGELNENKNHDVIIRALSKINNPGLYYIICGEGGRGDYLRELASDLGVGDNVKLLGYQKDIAGFCAASDVFALPSKREGLGLAAIEAMSCGLPLVTSDVHGINDYSENGITGFKCAPNDADDFAEAIMKLYSDPGLRISMGEINKKLAKRYDIGESIREMKEIYEEVEGFGG